MEVKNNNAAVIRNLQPAEFNCRSCRTQATREADRICGLCKAMGKNVDPKRTSLADLFSAAAHLPVLLTRGRARTGHLR